MTQLLSHSATRQPTAPKSPPPATGAWLPGHPVGRRQWATLPTPLRLESGAVLPDVHIAYETWGERAPDGSNAVLLLHALTGDSHVGGPAGPGHPTAGWWDQFVGAGRPLDLDRWFLVVPNVLGGCQGSTGPSSTAPDGRPWGSRFPALTVRDQVNAEIALADALGVDTWAAVIGGSMGGMRALEWAVGAPDRVRRLGLLACSAVSSANQIAWSSPQLHAIRSDPGWHGGDYHHARPGHGPHRGLGIARRIAHITYRGELELNARFGRRRHAGDDQAADDRYAVESYLDHHAEKLTHRFDAGSYLTLTEAMNSHDIGRDRGGVVAALHRIRARTVVAGISSDRLFPLPQQRLISEAVADCAGFSIVDSPVGHDAFLAEGSQIGAILTGILQ